jgi:hypothetical protein
MSKPFIHSLSSARRFGGQPEDYLPLHDFMDSTKAVIADNRHRAILHSSFGIFILEKVFGTNITNSDGRLVSVRDIGEQHILEDFGGRFIPTPQDYLEHMELKDWMNNGKGVERPSSFKMIAKREHKRVLGRKIIND